MRKLSRRILVHTLAFALSVGVAKAAAAQQKDKQATEAFKSCRDQEKYGDATSCWRAWLDKHKAAAHEAEVLYAEEKAKPDQTSDTPESDSDEASAEEPGDESATGSEARDARATEQVEAEASLEDLESDDTAAAPAPAGIGLSLIAHGTAASFFMNEGEQRFALSPTEDATYSVASFGYGGGLSVGYRLDKLLKWRDTHVRLGAERLVGEGDGTGVGVTHADLVFEKGFPLGPKLKLYVAVGPSLAIVDLKLVPPPVFVPDQTRDVQELNSTRLGGTGRAGLELALGAAIGARLEAAVRINTRGYYEPDTGSVIYWDFEQRRDSYSSAGARLGLVVMF